MSDHAVIWCAYAAGCLLALVAKWGNWVSNGFRLGKGIGRSTREWFSLALLEDKVSWLVTIALVWAIGGVYVNDLLVDVPGLGWLGALPTHISIAFLLGVIAEYVAPGVFKRLLKKLLPENGEPR